MVTPVAGVQEQVWAKEEAQFDTFLAFVDADSLCVVETSIEPEQDWVERAEKCGTASNQGEVEGQRRGSWSIKVNKKPNPTVGAVPRMGALLKAGMGVETINVGTSVVYSLADALLPSLQIGRYLGPSLWEQANGAIVEQVEFEMAGGEIITATFSGSFARYSWAYESDTDATGYSATDTAITLKAGHGPRIGEGALIAFGAEDNGGAGYRVTDVQGDVITITPGLAGPLAASELDVLPVVPGFTDTDTPCAAISSAVTIDGTEICFRTAKVTLETGMQLLEGEACANRAKRAGRGKRMVTWEGEFYFLEENLSYLGGTWDGTVRNILTRFGEDTAAKRMKVSLPAVRLNVAPLSIPEAETVTYTIEGMARQNAAAADEMVVTFD